jgi:hypothetical protein
MDIQITITNASIDTTGPFDIIGNPGAIIIATLQTKSELELGKTFTGISDLITSISMTDTGICDTTITKPIIGV